LIICCTLALGARAETRSFPEYGFSIDMPEWWEPVSENPQGTVFAMHGPKKDRTIFVVLTRVRPTEAGTTLAGIIVDVRKQLEQSGFEIKGEGHVQSNGIEWTTINASGPNNVDSTLWIDLTPERLYLLRADNLVGGKLAGDAEVQATLRTFRLIPITESEQSKGDNEGRADFLALGLGILVGVLGAGLAVFLAIRPQGRKKK
jgi:hypothetical protein